MKKIIIAVLSLICVSGFSADYFYNFTNGLVAYYPLDGNLIDRSGQGNDLSNQSCSFSSNRFNVASSAACFNGVNSVAAAANVVSPIHEAFTFSAWVNIPSYAPVAASQNWLSLIRKDGDCNLMILNQNSMNPGLSSAPVLYMESVSNPDPSGSVLNYGTTASLPTEGVWTQIVVTWDGMDFKVFLNGNRTKDVTAGQSPCVCNCPGPQIPLEPVSLGDSILSPGSPFNGRMSDARIYNRALSLSEIKRLYNWENHIQTLPPYN